MQNAKELEQGIAAFAGEANAALIVTASARIFNSAPAKKPT
jgi:hypothetical protein